MKNSNLKEYIRRGFGVLLIIYCVSPLLAQKQQQIDNLTAFAKVYGYVKYFHPSDEAYTMNWDDFAIYGAEQVEKCKSKKELMATLRKLFKPVAPSINFYEDKARFKFNMDQITPRDLKGYELTYWQHKGVGFNMYVHYENSPYHSVRVNGMMNVREADQYGKLNMTIDAEQYRGKEIKYTAWVKMKEGIRGTGHLRLQVIDSDGATSFHDGMLKRPVKDNEWKQYEIIGKVDSSATTIVLGGALKGKGQMFLDEARLSYKEGEVWLDIPVKDNSFEALVLTSTVNNRGQWSYKGNGYDFDISKEEYQKGKKSAVITFTNKVEQEKGKQIFDYKPEFGELTEKRIGKGMFCSIPLVLYRNDNGTYPAADKKETERLIQDTENVSLQPETLAFRLGNIINTYNVFRHFYPYFDEIDVNWDKELEKALLRCYTDKTENDHLITLQKFTAPLRDGHINISGGSLGNYLPPILWEWIEERLVITDVTEEGVPLKAGDIVTQIDGLDAGEYFEEINSRISAGTKGWRDYVAAYLSLEGKKDSKMVITVNGRDIALVRKSTYHKKGPQSTAWKPEYKYINDSVIYLNITKIKMESINRLMPELEKMKSIICDLRGYPNRNHKFISHLLKVNDTAKSWMRIPEIVYPDQQHLVGYWGNEPFLKRKKPYLGDKQIIFIINGEAISYAETYMCLIEGYKLATIIGQPTAGTDGNYNLFKLPGGYGVKWTGMKMVKLDGSQLHAVGIIPDIYVNKTIEGVKAGKDELLEKAIDMTSGHNSSK